MKRNQWIVAGLVALFFSAAGEAYGDPTGKIEVAASTAVANGGSFRIRYIENKSGRTITNIATTPAIFTNIKKGTLFTIDQIQASVNGCTFAGATTITDMVPHNGKLLTETLVYGTTTTTTVIPVAPKMSVSMDVNGSMHLSFSGAPSQTLSVQATTSLAPANWTTVSTAVLDVNGSGSFTDTDAPLYQARFYRAVVSQ